MYVKVKSQSSFISLPKEKLVLDIGKKLLQELQQRHTTSTGLKQLKDKCTVNIWATQRAMQIANYHFLYLCKKAILPTFFCSPIQTLIHPFISMHTFSHRYTLMNSQSYVHRCSLMSLTARRINECFYLFYLHRGTLCKYDNT